MADVKLDDMKPEPLVEDEEVLELAADPAVLERLVEDASVTDADYQADFETLVINLEDLLPDGEGGVVLVAEDGVLLSVVAEQPLRDSGIVEQHVTVTGVDVEGHHYYSFENGVTVYSEMHLVIVDA